MLTSPGLWRTVVFAVALLQTSPGWADDAQARALYQQATADYAAGHFEKALQGYRAAFAAKPLPGFHFNIGQCHRELGHHAEALDAYRSYLRDSPAPKHRQQALQLIELTEQALAREAPAQAPSSAPAPAAPSAPATPEPEPEPTPTPTPEARTGFTSARPARDTASTDEGRHGARGRSGRRLSPILFWSSAALGVALFATAGITQGIALDKSAEFKQDSTPIARRAELKDSGELLNTTSIVTAAAGGVIAAATIVLYFYTDFGGERHDGEPDDSLAATVLPGGGAAFSFSGRF